MKQLKKYFDSLDKTGFKKVASILVLVFFAMIMLFQKDNQTSNLQFVRNNGEISSHGSPNTPPSQRDYLFQDESGTTVYQGTIPGDQTTSGRTENFTGTLTGFNDFPQNINDPLTQTGTIFTGNSTGGIRIVEKPDATDCISPWGEEVNNGDFVLGYQQREDVSTMCNIEKRICNNGVLGGTFSQGSCKEDVLYIYAKAEVISYNQKVLNEFIQPPAPVNEGAVFNTQGKINQTEKGTDKRGTTNNPVRNIPAQGQDLAPNKLNCKTARGQTIKHGQFVKAYKSPRGFIDLSCDVEIRACIDGKLKGKYFYPKCTFYNTTSTDYIKAGFPKTNAGLLFFERIKEVFGL